MSDRELQHKREQGIEPIIVHGGGGAAIKSPMYYEIKSLVIDGEKLI